MANLRNKIFGLVGASCVFAGMAFGQAANCSSLNANGLGQVDRLESATDLVTETVLTCTTPATVAVISSAAAVPPAPAAITLFVSAPVTSKLLQTVATGVQWTEALAIVSVAGCFGTPGCAATVTSDFVNTGAGLAGSIFSVTQGVITPAGISFTGIATPALAGVAGASTSYQIQFVNVRVNATGGATSISEQAFITGSAILNPGAPAATSVATVASGLAPAKLTATFPVSGAAISTAGQNNAVCVALVAQTGTGTIGGVGSTAVQTPNFWVHTGETFQTAFKTILASPAAPPNAVGGTAAQNNLLGSEFLNNSETGFVPAAFPSTVGASNVASTGTRIQVVFNNVPAGLNIYVPLVVNNDGAATAAAVTGTLSLTSNATGAFSAPTAVAASGSFSSFTGVSSFPVGAAPLNVGGISQLTVTGTTATAIYEVTAQSPIVVEAYSIPVFLGASAGTLGVTTSAMTVTTSFAPIVTSTAAPLANIPSFVNLSTALTAINETSCSTTLIFPYVTQGNGFDVGIAIENTSNDNLVAVAGSTVGKSSATNQSGTCSLNYYGSGGNITPSFAGTPFLNSGATTAFTFSSAPATTTAPYTATFGPGASNLLSVLNPGFTGYIIASCSFQFAHGYAYIFTNYGTANATVTSYLPLVVPSNAAARVAPESIAH
jgi:hypothetical protein